MHAAPAPCRQALAPSRDGLGGAVAWLCPWDWRAALGAQAPRPFVLGHALSKNALHGGPAPNATSASHQSAPRRRGGMRPHAAGSPAERRAPRERRSRRTPLRRNRAALLAHGPKTQAPSPWPARDKPRAENAPRDGVAARCDASAVPTPSTGDLARSPADAQRRRALARCRPQTTQHPNAQPLAWCQPVPGLGTRRRRGLRADISPRERGPRGQDCAA
jgi:hypothetical protein